MKRISKILGFGIHIFKQLNWPARILIVLFAFLIFTAVAVEVTGQPGFCNSCHIMNTFYESWKVSDHSEVNCLDCHLQPGFTGYVKGKLNGLAQLVDCVVGRVGTKPSAFVFDISCLRSECHNVEELTSKEIDFNDVKFSHEKHINSKVDGVTITCGLCHSHFEGNEHFKVNEDSCYTCHFLENPKDNKKVVDSNCLDCHDFDQDTLGKEIRFHEARQRCLSCHKEHGLLEAGITKMDHTLLNGELLCSQCHFDPHKGLFGQNCRDCHGIRDWKIAGYHHPAEDRTDCNRCHKGPASHYDEIFWDFILKDMGMVSIQPENCGQCHTISHWPDLKP